MIGSQTRATQAPVVMRVLRCARVQPTASLLDAEG